MHVLGGATLVRAWQALLLEVPVVVTCHDPTLLTPICNVLTSLIAPLRSVSHTGGGVVL